MMETILSDIQKANKEMSVIILRYFNPVGAHPSGLIGENPRGIPNNLMPFVLQVADGQRDHINVFGHDYDTPDHTCIRDYVHVMDIAEGHVAALEWLFKQKEGIKEEFNLGTGCGASVLDVIHGVERACGHEIKYILADRRPGDLPAAYCNPSKAEKILNWKCKRSLDDMCVDGWRWQQMNPNGY